MSRALAREDAFKLVFEMAVTNVSADEAINYLFETVDKKNEMWAQDFINAANRAYIKELVKGIEEKEDELNALITPTLKDWTIARIAKVNLAILQLAVYEIYYIEDIPHKVSVNEAITLAKKYAGKESASFINGVLGTLLDSIENSQK